MQIENQDPLDMEYFLIYNDSPLILKSDNAKVMTSKVMKKILRKERITQVLTKQKHQNWYIAERIVQVENI